MRKTKGNPASFTSTGGSKRKTVGVYPGGAQGMVAETHKVIGTRPSPDVTFAHPVKTVTN